MLDYSAADKVCAAHLVKISLKAGTALGKHLCGYNVRASCESIAERERRMRILVYSDLHIGIERGRIGRSLLPAMTEASLDALRQCVDLAVEHDVDAVMDCGDTQDSPSLSNLALGDWLEQHARLTEAGIDQIVIEGNHNHPRLAEWGSPLELLGANPKAKVIHREAYEQIELGDRVVIHAVPWMRGKDELHSALRQIQPVSNRINLMMAHFGVDALKVYQRAHPDDQVVSLTDLPNRMDMVFIGHYHHHKILADNVMYVGAAVRTNFGEVEHQPQALLLDIDQEITLRWLPLQAPPMLDLHVDAHGLSPSEVKAAIEDVLSQVKLEESFVRLRVLNVDQALRKAIDLSPVIAARQNALLLAFEMKKPEEPTKAPTAAVQSAGEELEDIIDAALREVAATDEEYERLQTLDRRYRSLKGVSEAED